MLALTACSAQPAWPFSLIPQPAQGIHKIQHIVIIMQENRSFDHYFGTYPGADGLPRQNGQFTVCVNDPRTGVCVSILDVVVVSRRESGWSAAVSRCS